MTAVDLLILICALILVIAALQYPPVLLALVLVVLFWALTRR